MKTATIEFKDKAEKFYELFPVDRIEKSTNEEGFRTTLKTKNRLIMTRDISDMTDLAFEERLKGFSEGIEQIYRDYAREAVQYANAAVPSWEGKVQPIWSMNYSRHKFVTCECSFTESSQLAVVTIDGEWEEAFPKTKIKPNFIQRIKGLIR